MNYTASIALYEHADVQHGAGECKREDLDAFTSGAFAVAYRQSSGFSFEVYNNEPADGDYADGFLNVAYTCPEVGCGDGEVCAHNQECQSGLCLGGVCSRICADWNAVDLGVPGQQTTVDAGGCVKIQDGRPSYWSDSAIAWLYPTNGTYPLPFSWTSTCAGGGSGELLGNWQAEQVGPVASGCPTIIDLEGIPGSSVTLHYW
jgi:hypothetical protein